MKALVLSSGGVDSTTALGLAVKKYGRENVIALSVFYGQKHDKEIKASVAEADYYGVEHLFLDLSVIFKDSNCSLLRHSTEEIPEESYAEQIKRTEGEKPVSTYVPFRNGLFNCIISFKGTDNKRECYRRNSPIISVGQTVAPPKTNSSDKACACLDPFADSRINHRARIDSVGVTRKPHLTRVRRGFSVTPTGLKPVTF